MNIQFPERFPVACHTKNIGPGSTFVAIRGTKFNGLDYAQEAIAKGARKIVLEHGIVIPEAMQLAIKAHNVVVERVGDTREALARLSAQAHNFPAKKLKIIAVTGTKGKTTSCFIMHHILHMAGLRVALLTSVRNSIDGHEIHNTLTTEQPDYLHTFFALCVEQKIEYVVMEVAAQAFSLHRVDGIEFCGAIFTNFDNTHGEFYQNMHEYFDAKCQLFNHMHPDASVVMNRDNFWCATILKNHKNYKAFSLNEARVADANVSIGHIQKDLSNGINFTLSYKKTTTTLSCPSLMGTSSAYNILGVATLALDLGIDQFIIQDALMTLPYVPGRLERHTLRNGASCVIDHAHNPLSFESVLSTLRPLTNQLIVVFGCGGDRDKTMRPQMGAIANRYADVMILTTDNPRSEKPDAIIDDIRLGIAQPTSCRVEQILDRNEAIMHAYALSKPGSLIALLGKGREEYQLIGDQKIHFSDTESIQNI